MFEFGNSAISSLGTTLLTATIATIIILAFRARNYFRRHKSLKNNEEGAFSFFSSIFDTTSKALPPLSPASRLTVAHAITTSEAPWFLLSGARTLGPIYRLRLPLHPFGPTFVVVCDPKVARTILGDPTSIKPKWVYAKTDPYAGGKPNLFSAEGCRWKHSRRAVAAAFSSRNAERMGRICNARLNRWVQETLEPSITRQESIDVFDELNRLTVKIIAEAAFEYYCMSSEEIDVYIEDEHIALPEYLLRLTTIREHIGFVIPSVRRAERAKQTLQTLAKRILDHYRNEVPHPVKDTVLDCICRNESYESDEERISDIIVFLTAGHDSTGAALAWTMLELARNPSEQAHLRGELLKHNWGMEVRDKSGDSNGTLPPPPPPALRRVVREGMRLHPPPAAGVYREMARDLDVGQYVIPKGSTVNIVNIALHRSVDVFDDPDVFRPSRWIDPEGEDGGGNSNGNNMPSAASPLDGRNISKKSLEVQKLAYLPFASGRRNCIGQNLAMTELYIVIGKLICQYEWTIDEKPKTDFFLTLKPLGTKLFAQKEATS